MGGSCSCFNSGPKRTTLVALAPSSSLGLVGVEILEVGNCSRAIEEEIEHSKSHWSLLSEFELGVDEVAEVNNVEVFRALQSHPEWGTFFQTFGEYGLGKLVMGKKFAEGGQAKLYDAHIEWNDPRAQEEDLQLGFQYVLKVFKKGTSLQQLQLQWPSGLLQNHVERKEQIAQGFFRYPEILQACKDYSIRSKPTLFTREADAYNYGMLCYEILTGKLPFEEHSHGDFEHVLLVVRLVLPEYVDGWVRELLRRCWQSNPVDRPFEEILEILLANSEACRETNAYQKKCEAEIAMGIFKPVNRSLGK